MNKINYSKNEASFCYKDACIKVVGSLATVLTIGVVVFLVGTGVSNLLEGKK